MIRDDRELLAEMARLNSAMASFALRVIDGSASAAEQQHYAQRLIAVGERLRQRANRMKIAIIDGEVVDGSITLPVHAIELDQES